MVEGSVLIYRIRFVKFAVLRTVWGHFALSSSASLSSRASHCVLVSITGVFSVALHIFSFAFRRDCTGSRLGR